MCFSKYMKITVLIVRDFSMHRENIVKLYVLVYMTVQEPKDAQPQTVDQTYTRQESKMCAVKVFNQKRQWLLL